MINTDQFLVGVMLGCFHQHQGMSTASAAYTHNTHNESEQLLTTKC